MPRVNEEGSVESDQLISRASIWDKSASKSPSQESTRSPSSDFQMNAKAMSPARDLKMLNAEAQTEIEERSSSSDSENQSESDEDGDNGIDSKAPSVGDEEEVKAIPSRERKL